ncbi:MAG: hypothetical protein LBK63_03585 [Treponema sp.]|jgi:hypothetical protein|nr:hypothetical protein [Treponema sp.]
MRITHPKPALALALCFLLAPFALGQSGPADLDSPAEPEVPADLASPALPDNSAGLEEAEGEEPPSLSGDDELAVEDLEELSPEDLDLEMTVYYDERNGTDYVEIRTPEKIEEYHYLSHIRYSDLIYVLSDLLRRITSDGYQWATAPQISYEKNEEVALLYRKDLVEDVVYGIVQFPDFKVSLSGVRKPDAEHRFNAENGRDMMALVFSFASCLAQAEQTLGIKQLEYTMRFFKQN